MKKFLSLVLALALICGLCTVFASAAAGTKKLQFNQNGKFTVVNICDIQDGYPLNSTVKTYLNEMLAQVKPGLVILGGDNTVSSAADKEKAIEEICNIFVENKTYFTLVFGNHDHQQMFEGDKTRAEQTEGIKLRLLAMYQKYGKDYCLAYDAVPSLSGVGTHNLPVYSSNGKKIAYNFWMFDSNTYYPVEDNDKGYDAVHTDQIKWYKDTAAALKAGNGGKVVPAMAFQHIIVQEIYDKLFIETPFSCGKIGEDFEGAGYDGVKHFIYLPKVANLQEGYLFEKPCPGYYNYGQLDAMVETGDVKAVFSGHDHTNNFTVNINGIDVINTAGCTYNSYGSNLNRGCRVIVLDENDTSTYETYTHTLAKACLADGSNIAGQGDITKAAAVFSIIGDKLLTALMAVVKVIFFCIK